jgi:hypothetical protein
MRLLDRRCRIERIHIPRMLLECFSHTPTRLSPPTMPKRFAKRFHRSTLWIAFSVALLFGCHDSTSPKSVESENPSPIEAFSKSQTPDATERISPDDFRGAKDYVTSAACQECHAKQHSSWESTYHRTMTQEATSSTIQGNFDAKMIKVGGYPCIPSRQGDKFFMTVVHPTWDEQEIKAGRDPQATPLPPAIMYSVDRVIGSSTGVLIAR